jgi:mannosyltransferase
MLAGITLLAALLRGAQAGESLWVDELHTSWTVAGGVTEVTSRAAAGNQSPLYFFLVWAVTSLLGTSEVTLRLPSLVAGIALVPLVYWTAANWLRSRAAGLLAAVLIAVDPHCIFYAQEARTYALVQIVAVLELAVFWRLLQSPKTPSVPARVAFAMSSAALFYLHYTAAMLVVAELVCYAVLWLQRNWRPAYRPSQLAIDLAVVAVLCLPSIPHLLEVASRRGNWAQFVSAWPTPAMNNLIFVYVLLPVALAVIAVAVRWAMKQRPLRNSVEPRLAVLMICWLGVPAAMAWLATYTEFAHLFMLRYLVVSLVAPMVFAALCFTLCPGKSLKAIVALVIIGVAVDRSGIVQQFRADGRIINERNEDWRGAVKLINETTGDAHLPVLVNAGLIEADALRGPHDDALRDYCVLPVTGIYRISDRRLIPLPYSRPGQLSDDAARAIMDAGGAWLVIRAEGASAKRIASDVFDSLRTAGSPARVDRTDSFGNVTVIRVLDAGRAN